MAQDMATERAGAMQHWQARLLGEGARADQRVVAPVISLGSVPPGEAMSDQWPVHATSELLEARQQRGRGGNDRQRLDQPDIRMAFHGGNETQQRIGGHYAVGIQNKELWIAPAPASYPVGDVARLAADIHLAMPVKDAAVPPGALAQHQE